MDNDEDIPPVGTSDEPSMDQWMDAFEVAPHPQMVACTTDFPDRPPQYGQEFHGSLSREDADRLLLQEGCYLVRRSGRSGDAFTLSIRIDPDNIVHYPLHYDIRGNHFVGVEGFNTIHKLVKDIIVNLNLYRHSGYDPRLTGGNIVNIPPAASVDAGSFTTARSSMSHSDMSDYGSLTLTSSVQSFTSGTPNAGSYAGSSTSARTRSVTPTNATEVNEYEKAHRFKEKRFSNFAQCRFCQDSTLPAFPGFKCIDCGMQAHKRCGRTSPNDCMPERTRVKKVFGTDLTTLVKAYGSPVPFVVEICVREIRLRGLDVEGIYRRSGNKPAVRRLIQEFDENRETTDVSQDRYPFIHTVAVTLKEYFRKLPLALINGEYYDRLIEIVEKDGNSQLKPESIGEMREVMLALPPAHFHTLKYFCQHLKVVSEHNTTNLMTTENLALSVSPSLIIADDIHTSMKNNHHERTLMNEMIRQHLELFGN